MPAKDEELREVEIFRIFARRRPARCEGKASEVIAVLDQKRMVDGRLCPIEGKFVVPEATLRPELDWEDLAQIVYVQLQEIAQHRSHVRRCTLQVNCFGCRQTALFWRLTI